ncbi:hypothetical protein GCM10027047_38590 [Rhodococcus aerolatus]
MTWPRERSPASVVARGVGPAPQGGVGRHALRHRQQGRQVGHRVGGGPQGDAAVSGCAASASCDGPWVGGAHLPAHARLEPGVTDAVELGLVSADRLVDGRAAGPIEAARLPGHRRRGLLVQPPGPQGLPGAGQVGGEVPRETEQDPAAVRGDPAGQRDLGGHALPAAGHRHPVVGLPRPGGHVEGDGEVGLHGARRGLQLLELGQQVDPVRVRGEVAAPGTRERQQRGTPLAHLRRPDLVHEVFLSNTCSNSKVRRYRRGP